MALGVGYSPMANRVALDGITVEKIVVPIVVGYASFTNGISQPDRPAGLTCAADEAFRISSFTATIDTPFNNSAGFISMSLSDPLFTDAELATEFPMMTATSDATASSVFQLSIVFNVSLTDTPGGNAVTPTAGQMTVRILIEKYTYTS
jgi:hypothetical protein